LDRVVEKKTNCTAIFQESWRKFVPLKQASCWSEQGAASVELGESLDQARVHTSTILAGWKESSETVRDWETPFKHRGDETIERNKIQYGEPSSG